MVCSACLAKEVRPGLPKTCFIRHHLITYKLEMLAHGSASKINCRNDAMQQLLEAINSSHESLQDIPQPKARRVRSLVCLLTSRLGRTHG